MTAARRLLPLIALALAAPARADLAGAEVLVVANAAVPASVEVAEHYVKVRQVPVENLIKLDLVTTDEMPHADYEAKVAAPLRAELAKRPGVRCILVVYGVPLRVANQVPTDAEKARQAELAPKLKAARDILAKATGAARNDAARGVARLEDDERKLTHAESHAALDSELMLLKFGDYPRERWVVNPLYWQYPAAKQKAIGGRVLFTARLDGPTPAVAKRLVDDALAVEAAGGLKGRAYVDARGLVFDAKKPGAGLGYEGYDESFRELAAVTKDAGFDTTLDNKPELFAANSCPDAAIYCGWYALTDYRKSNTFARGAVAWHLASYEAGTLKGGNKLWCPNLLSDGAAVTLGPVAEPYTLGFPKPAEFFAELLRGEDTLVECYARTLPLTSWTITLIGDPLYKPFGKSKPGAKLERKASPAGLRFPVE